MNPPNSAPITSIGTRPGLVLSTAMPSSPIRLTASVPPTRCRMPSSTSLNDTPLLPLLHLREPLLELLHFGIRTAFAEGIEFVADVGVVRLALQDRFVDLARFVALALLRVEIGHRCRLRDVGRHFRGEGRRIDVHPNRLLDRHRDGGVIR